MMSSLLSKQKKKIRILHSWITFFQKSCWKVTWSEVVRKLFNSYDHIQFELPPQLTASGLGQHLTFWQHMSRSGNSTGHHLSGVWQNWLVKQLLHWLWQKNYSANISITGHWRCFLLWLAWDVHLGGKLMWAMLWAQILVDCKQHSAHGGKCFRPRLAVTN